MSSWYSSLFGKNESTTGNNNIDSRLMSEVNNTRLTSEVNNLTEISNSNTIQQVQINETHTKQKEAETAETVETPCIEIIEDPVKIFSEPDCVNNGNTLTYTYKISKPETEINDFNILRDEMKTMQNYIKELQTEIHRLTLSQQNNFDKFNLVQKITLDTVSSISKQIHNDFENNKEHLMEIKKAQQSFISTQNGLINSINNLTQHIHAPTIQKNMPSYAQEYTTKTPVVKNTTYSNNAHQCATNTSLKRNDESSVSYTKPKPFDYDTIGYFNKNNNC